MIHKHLCLLMPALIATVLTLSGCGGGDGGNIPSAGNSAGAAASDGFVTRVMSMMLTVGADDAEPASNDPVAVSAPDNAEPVPLM
jgi:hypothetical protein